MTYDGWIKFHDTEIANLSRTVQRATALGIDTLWYMPEDVAWIGPRLGQIDYALETTTPWYDSSYLPSTEFAGMVPLSVDGFYDSPYERDITEYNSDGAAMGLGRTGSATLVFNAVLVATTDRGAQYGLEWLKTTLRDTGAKQFYTGTTLTYFADNGANPEVRHRRSVGLTRDVSVTRKRTNDCSTAWWVTFTLVATDGNEYSDPVLNVDNLGASSAATGARITTSGSRQLNYDLCPVYDYSPVQDPLFPNFVSSPTAPQFYPNGWTIKPGDAMTRWWARVPSPSPVKARTVPLLALVAPAALRMVRVGIWPGASLETAQCGALFQAMITYLPGGTTLYIDGESKACYTSDGGPVVRRADGLCFAGDGAPVQWVDFSDPAGLFVTLDVDNTGTDPMPNGSVSMDMSLIRRS